MHLSKALMLVVLAGCASGGSAPSGEAPAATERRNRDVLLQDEIASRTGITSAYDAIRQLRPTWMRGQRMSGTESTSVAVYVNGTRTDAQQLHQILASTIAEARFLDAGEATMRFGTGHGNGAIEMKTVVR